MLHMGHPFDHGDRWIKYDPCKVDQVLQKYITKNIL